MLRNQNGKYFSAYGDDNNPGVLTMTLEPTDPSGTLTVQWLKIIDTLGNDEVYYYSDSLEPWDCLHLFTYWKTGKLQATSQ